MFLHEFESRVFLASPAALFHSNTNTMANEECKMF